MRIDRQRVLISNFTIRNCYIGIFAQPTSPWGALWFGRLVGAQYAAITRNKIINNYYGVKVECFEPSLEAEGYISIVGNEIANNSFGLWLERSSSNRIYDNNFRGNTYQVLSYKSVNVWDNSYPHGGNYWSDYGGIDVKNGAGQDLPGSDGIGDTPYAIDTDNLDKYPLVGSINIFDASTWNEVTYSVHVASNSTISSFYFNPEEGAFLRFNVTGDDGTTGFCRVAIPKSLLWVEDGWAITVDDQPITDYVKLEDENFTYLYFTYSHSTQTVTIQGTNVIPEYTPISLPILLLLVTTLATIINKKQRKPKTSHYPESKILNFSVSIS
ncbi:MAG: NosD domain-containing protein [Candidatus Bathyarchaeia archaeon]